MALIVRAVPPRVSVCISAPAQLWLAGGATQAPETHTCAAPASSPHAVPSAAGVVPQVHAAHAGRVHGLALVGHWLARVQAQEPPVPPVPELVLVVAVPPVPVPPVPPVPELVLVLVLLVVRPELEVSLVEPPPLPPLPPLPVKMAHPPPTEAARGNASATPANQILYEFKTNLLDRARSLARPERTTASRTRRRSRTVSTWS